MQDIKLIRYKMWILKQVQDDTIKRKIIGAGTGLRTGFVTVRFHIKLYQFYKIHFLSAWHKLF